MEQHHDLSCSVAVVGIVDDDPAVRNSLKFSLEIEGFAVGVLCQRRRAVEGRRFVPLPLPRHRSEHAGHERARPRGGASKSADFGAGRFSSPVNPPRALIARADKAGVPIVEKPLLGNALLDNIRDLVGRQPPPSVWAKAMRSQHRELAPWSSPSWRRWRSRYRSRRRGQRRDRKARRGLARQELRPMSRDRPHRGEPAFRGAAVPNAVAQISDRAPRRGLGGRHFVGHPDMPEFVFEAGRGRGDPRLSQIDPRALRLAYPVGICLARRSRARAS